MTTGNMRLFFKNFGSVKVDRALPTLVMKIIPEKKRGDSFIDERPPVTCSAKANNLPDMIPIIPGEEKTLDIRQSVITTPQLTDEEHVQLYATVCIDYAERFGPVRTTCDTYRLVVPSRDPIDSLNGTPSFVCSDKPMVGRFAEELTGHCAN